MFATLLNAIFVFISLCFLLKLRMSNRIILNNPFQRKEDDVERRNEIERKKPRLNEFIDNENFIHENFIIVEQTPNFEELNNEIIIPNPSLTG